MKKQLKKKIYIYIYIYIYILFIYKSTCNAMGLYKRLKL